MAEVYSKKTKSKIAYRMVFFSALNESRPRTEHGQPMTPFKRDRSSTDFICDVNSCHERPVSTPDLCDFSIMNRVKSDKKKNMASHYENLELLVPYKVKIFDDGVDQLSVEQLIKNFECQNEIIPPNGVKVEDSINSEDNEEVSDSNISKVFEPKKPMPTPRLKNDSTKSNHSKSDQIISDQTKSDQTKSDHTKIDHTKSDHSKSDHAKNDHIKSDRTKSDHTKSDQAKRDHTKNDHTKIDHTKSNHFKVDRSKSSSTQSNHTEYDHSKNNLSHNQTLLDEKYNNKFKLKFPPKENCTTSRDCISEEKQIKGHPALIESELDAVSHNKLEGLPANKVPAYLVVSISETSSNIFQSPNLSLKQSNSTDNIYLDPIEARKPDIAVKPDNLKINFSKFQQKQQNPKVDKRLSKFTKLKTVQQKIFKRSQSLPDILCEVQGKIDQICKIQDEDESSLDEDEGWNSDEFDSSSEDDESTVNPQLLDATSRKIYYIVLEILSTERAYVKRLYLLEKIFQEELLKESRENNIIPEKALGDIFSNLSSIYKFHSDLLLPDLERRLKEWTSNPKIGDIFKTLGHCLVLYTDFVKNFDNSVSTLNYWLKKSPKFAAAVEQIQMNPKSENLGLQHHMLEPIQRIPRYKLLLQDYIKKLPINSADYKEAQESLIVISKAAESANSSLRDNDKFKVLLNIQERIVDGLRGESLVTASRVFLKEGELTKLAARSGGRNNRVILLFNDLLLCCWQSTIGKLRVRQIMDLIGLNIVQDDSLPENSFRIQSRQRILDLIANTPEEKEEWVTAIKKAVDDIINRRGTSINKALENDEIMDNDLVGQKAPLWVKDEDVTMCMLCTLKFGLIYRKHHCRGCGRVICDKCSSYRSALAYTGNQIQRLCYSCYKKLNPNIDSESFPIINESNLSRQSISLSDMSGFLFWRAPGKSWSKEWVVLSDYVLYIQKKKQDIKARFTLPVPGYQVEKLLSTDEIDAPHPNCIMLHKENKKELTYYFSSDTKEVINIWESHLRFALLLEKLPKEREVENKL